MTAKYMCISVWFRELAGKNFLDEAMKLPYYVDARNSRKGMSIQVDLDIAYKHFGVTTPQEVYGKVVADFHRFSKTVIKSEIDGIYDAHLETIQEFPSVMNNALAGLS